MCRGRANWFFFYSSLNLKVFTLKEHLNRDFLLAFTTSLSLHANIYNFYTRFTFTVNFSSSDQCKVLLFFFCISSIFISVIYHIKFIRIYTLIYFLFVINNKIIPPANLLFSFIYIFMCNPIISQIANMYLLLLVVCVVWYIVHKEHGFLLFDIQIRIPADFCVHLAIALIHDNNITINIIK